MASLSSIVTAVTWVAAEVENRLDKLQVDAQAADQRQRKPRFSQKKDD